MSRVIYSWSIWDISLQTISTFSIGMAPTFFIVYYMGRISPRRKYWSYPGKLTSISPVAGLLVRTLLGQGLGSGNLYLVEVFWINFGRLLPMNSKSMSVSMPKMVYFTPSTLI